MTSYTRWTEPRTGKLLGVFRVSDGAFVPRDPDNVDWREFLRANATDPAPLTLNDDPPAHVPTQAELDAAHPAKANFRDLAATAVQANADFLALGNSVTLAQAVQQIRRLTMQNTAIIKRLYQLSEVTNSEI